MGGVYRVNEGEEEFFLMLVNLFSFNGVFLFERKFCVFGEIFVRFFYFIEGKKFSGGNSV